MTFSFTVWVTSLPEGCDLAAWSNALWEAGCDDSSPGIDCGRPYVHFDRESSSLSAAINSAVKAVRSTGAVVSRVEMLEEELIGLEAAELAHA